MKKIKLDHASAKLVRNGNTRVTWRLYDDKDLQVNDRIVFVDKVDSRHPETWTEFGPSSISAIVEKRLGDVVPTDFDNSELARPIGDLLKAFQKQYGPQVGLNTPVKIVHFEPISEEPNKTLSQKITQINDDNFATTTDEVKLYADGGSRGNPGPSASGYVIMTTKGKILTQKGTYLGVTTNNQAEYQALKLGLEEASRIGATRVHVYMDSLLVINQMLGLFKVKNRDLWPIHDAVQHLARAFKHTTFIHIPRELNKLADHAVNDVLDQVERQNH